jgi:hypothetical protein
MWNKKGNMNMITGLAYALVFFGIVVGIGSIVLYQFGVSTGGQANTNVQYVLTALGSTNGGLLSWLYAIIAVSVGAVLLGLFGLFGGGKGKY